jgi:hypothetical protein
MWLEWFFNYANLFGDFSKIKTVPFFWGGRWNIFLNTAHQETKPREGYRFHVAHKI